MKFPSVIALCVASLILPMPALGQEAPAAPPVQPDYPKDALGFTVPRGGKITFKVDAAGKIQVLTFDLADAARVIPPENLPPETTVESLNQANPGEITVSMIIHPQYGTVMRIDSRIGFAFDYDATMMVPLQSGGMRTERTSVCTVLDGHLMLERWPFVIDHIMLSGFRRYDGPQHCPEPIPEPSAAPPPAPSI